MEGERRDAAQGARREDDPFCRQLGERVGRSWLGPELATDMDRVLQSWTGALVRGRRYGAPARAGGLWTRAHVAPASKCTYGGCRP